MNDERRRKVRQAAMEVFLRYGYRKVTMDDIARGVGISRPALYLVFPNKEAVFRDLVEAGLDDLIEKIEAGLPSRATLADQLSHVFQVSSVGSFELVARAPAANELMNASFDFARDLFDRHEQRLAEILIRLIRGAVPEPDALRPPAQARARIMIAAAHGFKSKAKDLQDMRALVSDLVQMTVAGLPVAAGHSRPRPQHSGRAKLKSTSRRD
jgi:AcrR family transcriptional regulator